MRFWRVLPVLVSLALLMPVSGALADPPDHAPAHGYRAKGRPSRAIEAHAPVRAPRNGVEIVFDSERGVYVGIGIPDLFFKDGTYYRHHDGRWQVSPTGDGEWRRRMAFRIPDEVVAASKHSKAQPGLEVPAAPAATGD